MYFFFFFPVGTESRTGKPPVGTVLLLAILFGAFLTRTIQPTLYDNLVWASFRPSNPSLSAAFLSLFLHAGWGHLAGNALYLWIFGRQMEGRLGFLPLALLFVVGGTAACWAQAWLTPADSPYFDVPVIGASGAVASILGATLVRFPHRRVRILWLLFAFLGGLTKGGVTYVNGVVACLSWFVFQIVYGLVAFESGGAPVAYAAHTGGFVAGIVMALAMGMNRGPRREIHLDRGRRYFRKNDWYAAAGEFTSHLEIVPGDRDARRMRARCLVLLGRSGEAATEYLRLFREARAAGDTTAAASLYRETRVYGIGTTLSDRALLRLAFDFQKAGRAGDAAEAYREVANRFPAGEMTDLAAIRRAEILWSELGRYDEARECYRQLLDRTETGEWRHVAEARLRSMNALAGEPLPTSPSRGNRTPRRRPGARRKS